MTAILGSPEKFLVRLLENLDSCGIHSSELWSLDHLAYRTTSLSQYESFHSSLTASEKLIARLQINGRDYSFFHLAEPFSFKGYTIPVLELPAPSLTPYPEGFEHAAFVLESLGELYRAHPEVNFDTKCYRQDFDPHYELHFPKEMSAHFHVNPLLRQLEAQQVTRPTFVKV